MFINEDYGNSSSFLNSQSLGSEIFFFLDSLGWLFSMSLISDDQWTLGRTDFGLLPIMVLSFFIKG